jgi:ribulose-5-phosphate 4-epimerase/fuculose-1-phosphate aldolase
MTSYPKERKQMISVINAMWSLGLANTSGIAVSMRLADGNILSDRSGTGFRRCEITEDYLIVVTPEGHLIEAGAGRLAPVNTVIALAYYKANPLAMACVHCHPLYSQLFAIANLSILPFTLQSKLTGEMPCVYVDDRAEKKRMTLEGINVSVPTGIHSRPDVLFVMEQVGQKIVEVLTPRNAEMTKHGLAVNHYEHGGFWFGRDIDEAFENLVRIEANAKSLVTYFGSIVAVNAQYDRLLKGEIQSLNQF